MPIRILYPSVQQPVLTPAQRPETVTEPRWHRPWSEPVRIPRLAPAAQPFAFLVEASPFAEAVSEDRWHRPLSEPVRLPPRLAAGAQPATFFVAAEPFAETVGEDRWHRPWSEPVRLPPRLGTGAQQFTALVQAEPFAEAVAEAKWHQPFSEPVRLRALATAQQVFAVLGRAGPFTETVSEDRWHQPWSLPPVLARAALRAGAQRHLAYLFEPNSIVPPAPPVPMAGWFRPWSEPVRVKPGLIAGLQRFAVLTEAEPFFTDAFQRLVQGAALDDEVELYDLDATAIGGDVYRFTSTAFPDDMIRWNGNAYGPIPVETSGWQWSGRGPLPTPLLRVANVSLAFGAAVIAFGDLLGATLTRTRTFRRFLDGQPDADPDAHFPLDIYRVDRKRLHTKTVVEWELAAVMDQQGLYLPRRPILRNACTHRYRRYDTDLAAFDYTHATCPYAGSAYFEDTGATTADPAADHCGKRLTDCKKRFGALPLPTRAFPGVARLPT